MAYTTKDFPALTDDLESIYNEVVKTRIADDVGLSLFDVINEERLTHEHLLLHGSAGIERVAEGADLPIITNNEGDNIIFTQQYYGARVQVTKKMLLFELHNQMTSLINSVTQDAFDKIDQSMADVFLKGQVTSYVDVYSQTITSTGPSGQSIFGSAITNGVTSTTFSNLVTDGTNNNPALSREALVSTIALGRKYKDPNGLSRPVHIDTLVVGPDLADLAMRIVMSDHISGSANNDINPGGAGGIRGLKIIVWDRLNTAADGTDTSAFYFLLDSKKSKETFKAIFAQKPQLMAPDIVYSNKNWDYSTDYFYTLGRGYASGAYMSTGVN